MYLTGFSKDANIRSVTVLFSMKVRVCRCDQGGWQWGVTSKFRKEAEKLSLFHLWLLSFQFVKNKVLINRTVTYRHLKIQIEGAS